MTVKLDPKGNAVLVEFASEGGRVDALIFRGGNHEPFVYAYGYDAETGEWAQGRYFSDPARAYFAANPEIIEESAVWWQLGDYRAHLSHAGIEPTRSNVEQLKQSTHGMRGWADRATESGNEFIHETVEEAFWALIEEE